MSVQNLAAGVKTGNYINGVFGWLN